MGLKEECQWLLKKSVSVCKNCLVKGVEGWISTDIKNHAGLVQFKTIKGKLCAGLNCSKKVMQRRGKQDKFKRLKTG